MSSNQERTNKSVSISDGPVNPFSIGDATSKYGTADAGYLNAIKNEN